MFLRYMDSSVGIWKGKEEIKKTEDRRKVLQLDIEVKREGKLNYWTWK